MKNLLPLLFLFCTFAYGAVEVASGTDITAIEQHADQNTLVLLDLDDTLIRSKTTLGSPACFYRLRDRWIQKSPLPPEEVKLAFCLFDKALQEHVEYTFVDPASLPMIDRLQKRGIAVIGLTSRPHRLASVTADILSKLGISLGQTLPFGDQEISVKKRAVYDRGVIYVDDGKKSVVLDAFLQKLLPTRGSINKLVFADDKEMYVRDLEEYAQEKGYDYFGLYYIREKKKQRNVDLSIAERQMKYLINYTLESIGTPLDPKAVRLFFHAEPDEGWFYLHGRIIPDALLTDYEAEDK